MVSTSVIVPVDAGVNLYQTVLEVPVVKAAPEICEQAGTGSVPWVVAAELSTVLVKTPPVPGVTVVALAKLSFAGAGATTVKIGRVTV